MRSPRYVLVAITAALVTSVVGCGSDRTQLQVHPKPRPKHQMTQAQTPNVWAAGDTASALQRYAFGVFLSGVQASVQPQRLADPMPTVTPPIATVAPESSSTASVMACIRDHESGDYAESSHLGAGSGAYQYIPSTWQTWAARAGYDGYAYAYQAPPLIQDAVTDYTLTHGGAHNWDPSYGADSCTVGLP